MFFLCVCMSVKLFCGLVVPALCHKLCQGPVVPNSHLTFSRGLVVPNFCFKCCWGLVVPISCLNYLRGLVVPQYCDICRGLVVPRLWFDLSRSSCTQLWDYLLSGSHCAQFVVHSLSGLSCVKLLSSIVLGFSCAHFRFEHFSGVQLCPPFV